jgi:hypothetical protein
MQLFNTLKKEPYYKHYIYNHLRQFAERIDESVIAAPDTFGVKEHDFIQFDKINVYDFRRELP